MARQSNVDVKDRREAVLCLLRREEPAAVITRRIGVSEPTLYRWRDEFIAAGEAALASGSGRKGADPRDRRTGRRWRRARTGRRVRAGPYDPDSALATVGPCPAGEVGRDNGGGSLKRTSCRDFARIVRATRALIAAPGLQLASSPICRKETETVFEVSHKISPTDST
jgi:transposase-like protein